MVGRTISAKQTQSFDPNLTSIMALTEQNPPVKGSSGIGSSKRGSSNSRSGSSNGLNGPMLSLDLKAARSNTSTLGSCSSLADGVSCLSQHV